MAYMITDDCANCSACIDECPNQAISEGDSKCVIDPDKCTECDGGESKCASVCPSNACVPDPNHPKK